MILEVLRIWQFENINILKIFSKSESDNYQFKVKIDVKFEQQVSHRDVNDVLADLEAGNQRIGEYTVDPETVKADPIEGELFF